MSSHVYISYSELTSSSKDPQEFEEFISQFNKRPTFIFLMLLNYYLARSDEQRNFKDLQFHLAQNLLDKPLLSLLEKNFSGTDPWQRPLFFRQQFLALMKKTILLANDEGGFNPNDEIDVGSKFRLGEACLKTSDYLMSPEQEENISNGPSLEENKLQFISEAASQMVPVLELMKIPDFNLGAVRMLDFFAISETFPARFEGKTLPAFFTDLVGLSLKKNLLLTFGILSFYLGQSVEEIMKDTSKFNVSRKTLFTSTTFSEEEINAFFKLNEISFDELCSKIEEQERNTSLLFQYNFNVFRTYPLVFLSEDILGCIDSSFFIEKLSSGVYHTILNSLPPDKRESFFQLWGDVFEKYVNNLLRKVYPETSPFFFCPTYFNQAVENEAFDSLIKVDETLVVLEYKGKYLKASSKYSGRKDEFFEEVNSKFGRGKDGGVKQLGQKIEHLFNKNTDNRKSLFKIDLTNVKNIYPLLIVNDASASIGFSEWLLRELFENEINTRHIDKNIKIQPLAVIHIDDLEIIVEQLKEKKFTLISFLRYYVRSLTDLPPLVPFSQRFFSFCEKRKFELLRGQLMMSKLREIIKEFGTYFKEDITLER